MNLAQPTFPQPRIYIFRKCEPLLFQMVAYIQFFVFTFNSFPASRLHTFPENARCHPCSSSIFHRNGQLALSNPFAAAPSPEAKSDPKADRQSVAMLDQDPVEEPLDRPAKARVVAAKEVREVQPVGSVAGPVKKNFGLQMVRSTLFAPLG